MKVAVLSESSADEAAIRILVEALLGRETESPGLFPLRSRGWPSVRDILPNVIKHFHYGTDADALVVVVDANSSPMHDDPGGESSEGKSRSRLAQLSEVVRGVKAQLRAVPTRTPLRIAIGVAAPAIEAWYLCGIDPAVSEASWTRQLEGGAQARGTILSLKRQVYGADRYSVDLETERAIEHAHRLAQQIDSLERRFPIGFGTFAQHVRSWTSPTSR